MEQRIRTLLAAGKHALCTVSDPELYVTDWKDTDSSRIPAIEITSAQPSGIQSVCLLNSSQVKIVFDGFEENALPEDVPGDHCSQCECVLFPHDTSHPEHWVLFIEMKYANDKTCAFRKDRDYPHKMVNQIIDTVDYFRRKAVLSHDKKVHAIVSFPNLEDNNYHDMLFSELQESDLSVEEIHTRHKIVIRGGNQAKITSSKRINLKQGALFLE